MIRFTCPACHGAVSHPTAGDKLPCPHCGQRLQVPSPPVKKTVRGTWPPEPQAVGAVGPVALLVEKPR
jgi:DNA-directed RNA polymerase subunit RPC12/RpoP